MKGICIVALCLYSSLASGQKSETSLVHALNEKLTAANQAMEIGDYESAINALTEATNIDATRDLIWARLADAYLSSAPKQTDTTERAKRYGEAVTGYHRAIDLKKKFMETARRPDDVKNLAAYYNNLGQAEAKTGQLEESVKAYEMAAEVNPAGAAQYYYNQGAVLTNAGRNDEDIAAFDKSLAADPNKADSYQQRARLIARAMTARKTIPDASKETKAEELTGKVKVTSNPDGADIYCDGFFVGNTPSTLKLSAEKHTVEVTLPNQKNWSREITVQSGSDVTLNAILQPKDQTTRAATETPLTSASHSSTSRANGKKEKDTSAVLTGLGNTPKSATGAISGDILLITKGGDLKPARLAQVILLYGSDEGTAAVAYWNIKLEKMKEAFRSLATPGTASCRVELIVFNSSLKDTLNWGQKNDKRNQMRMVESDEEGVFRFPEVQPGPYTLLAWGHAGANDAYWEESLRVGSGQSLVIKMASPHTACVD